MTDQAANPTPPGYQTGTIRPLECLRSGWTLLAGQYWTFLGITTVALLLGSFAPLGIMLGPMLCGVYVCFFHRMRGEAVTFAMLFKGFEHFLQSIIATLIQIVPMMAFTIPIHLVFATFTVYNTLRRMGPPYDQLLDLLTAGELIAAVSIVSIVLIAISIFAGCFFMFTYPLIVERGMKGFPAVKLSARAAWANFRHSVVLMTITSLLGLAGLLLCYVGVFAMAPITLAAWAVAYRRVFPEQASRP